MLTPRIPPITRTDPEIAVCIYRLTEFPVVASNFGLDLRKPARRLNSINGRSIAVDWRCFQIQIAGVDIDKGGTRDSIAFPVLQRRDGRLRLTHRGVDVLEIPPRARYTRAIGDHRFGRAIRWHVRTILAGGRRD